MREQALGLLLRWCRNLLVVLLLRQLVQQNPGRRAVMQVMRAAVQRIFRQSQQPQPRRSARMPQRNRMRVRAQRRP